MGQDVGGNGPTENKWKKRRKGLQLSFGRYPRIKNDDDVGEQKGKNQPLEGVEIGPFEKSTPGGFQKAKTGKKSHLGVGKSVEKKGISH